MTDLEVVTGEVLSEDDYLEALASRVRVETKNLKLSAQELYEKFDGVGDDEAVAREVLEHLGVEGDAYDVLLPVITMDVQWWRRKRVRGIERGPVEQEAKKTETDVPTNPLLREKLLKETFALGDGSSVTWGAATVADHVKRVQFLSTMVDGLRATAAKHQNAVATIEMTVGAKCLNDVAKKKKVAA